MAILTNKKTGNKFSTGKKPFNRKGKAVMIGSRKNTLSVDELNKISKERQIRAKDLATDEEIAEGEAKIVSLNPDHEDLDLVFLKQESPISLSQKDFENHPRLREEEINEIKKSEGVDPDE